MSLISPGIYIGNFRDAQDMSFLQRNGISHILCSAAELEPYFKGKFKYKHVQANDLPSYNLSRHFDAAADFIHEAVGEGGSILVHCAAGISRSVSLALAYYLKHQNKKLHESLNFVKSRRYIANPNPGFIKQLREYEQKLEGERKRSQTLSPSPTPQNAAKLSATGFNATHSQLRNSYGPQQGPQNPKPSMTANKFSRDAPAEEMRQSASMTTGGEGFKYRPLANPENPFSRAEAQQQSRPHDYYGQSIQQHPQQHNHSQQQPQQSAMKATSSFGRGVTVQPPKTQQSKQQEIMQRNLQQQQAPNFRLNGVSVGRREAPKTPREQPSRPALKINNEGPVLETGGQASSQAAKGRDQVGGLKSAELYNRYLKMTLPNNYTEPKIAVHNQRGISQNNPHYKTMGNFNKTASKGGFSANPQNGQYPPLVRNTSQRAAFYY